MLRLACLAGVLAGLCCAAQPPVILISIDTLRADHLSAYGYKTIRTPHIDSFAEHGTLFENIQSQIPLTLPSHTCLFTSTYPFQNRIEENAERGGPGSVTLASVLRSHGYKTAAFIGSVFLESELGLNKGFDTYDSPFHFEAFSPISGSMFLGGVGRNPAVRDMRDGALVLRAARRWMAVNRGQPAFVFVHLFDLHKPYDPHPSTPRPPGVSGYDSELLYVDRLLGMFQRYLIDTGWWQRSLVVVLSDHGEGLGEHGEDSHGYFIYRSTVWVPLILHWPEGTGGHPARDARPGGLIDVAPTILDFLHIAPPASFEGQSLPMAGQHPVYSESVYAHDAFGWAPLRGLRVGAYEYIDAPKPELYNLQQDPQERNNLIRSQAARARSQRAELAKLLAAHAPKPSAAVPAVSPKTRALLGSLGYLSGGPRTRLGGPGADPKDRLPDYRLYESAQTALYNGRLEAAAADLRQLAARDPHNALALRDLGGAYVEERQYAKARECFKQVIAMAPDDYMAQYELGLADKHLNLKSEALEHLKAACKLAPEAQQCRHELESLQ